MMWRPLWQAAPASVCVDDFTSHILCCVDCFNLLWRGRGLNSSCRWIITHTCWHTCCICLRTHTRNNSTWSHYTHGLDIFPLFMISGSDFNLAAPSFLTWRWTSSDSYCFSSTCAFIFRLCAHFFFSLLCLVLQASLNKLMETLGQSEPYFVKCIRSNAEKVQCDSRLRTLRLFWFSFQSIFSFPLKSEHF